MEKQSKEFDIFHARKNRKNKLTPRSRVLHVKITGPRLVKKFAAFYVTRRSITAFTSTNHLVVSILRVSMSP